MKFAKIMVMGHTAIILDTVTIGEAMIILRRSSNNILGTDKRYWKRLGLEIEMYLFILLEQDLLPSFYICERASD